MQKLICMKFFPQVDQKTIILTVGIKGSQKFWSTFLRIAAFWKLFSDEDYSNLDMLNEDYGYLLRKWFFFGTRPILADLSFPTTF